MNKRTYTAPEAKYIKLSPEALLALSTSEDPADPKGGALSNRRGGQGSDIWGDNPSAASNSSLWSDAE